jgi:hypothetical protein
VHSSLLVCCDFLDRINTFRRRHRIRVFSGVSRQSCSLIRPNCQVCAHDNRNQIDLGLVCGVPRPTLAQRFGVTVDSLYRHGKNHVTASQAAAIMTAIEPSAIDLEALTRSESEGLLSNLVAQRARLSTIAQQAMEDGLPQVAIRAEAATLASLELVSKLLGQLVNRSQVAHTHLTLTPSYLKLRQALVAVLRPHPEIAAQVAEALRAIEQDDAEQIITKGKPVMIEHQHAVST